MSEKEVQQDVRISVPLKIINDLYSKTFVKGTDPIYNKELQGKAMIAGKTVTLLKFRPRLKLSEISIINPKDPKDRPKLFAKASFYFSAPDDENNQNEDTEPIANPVDKEVNTDLDISIDPTKGKIQINPKYAALEAKINSGGGEYEPEPFCQLTIPLKLEELKLEIPLGVSKFDVPFQAPINKKFVNSGTEFPIQGIIENNNIEFKYPIELEEQQK